MKKRYICALTITLIIIITGLHKIGVVPFNYAGKTEGQFEAVIISAPEEKEYVDVYKAKIENKTYLLYVSKSKKNENNKKDKNIEINKIKEQNKNYDLKIGDKISFNGKFTEPAKERNYGGFDYSLYLQSKGIKGIFKVENYNILEKLELKQIKFYENLRTKIKTIYFKNMNEKNAALISGLTIGDKTLVEDEVIENFRKASLSHVLAISGAHFSYIILAIATFSKFVKRKRFMQILSITAMIFFVNLTGGTPSVIRAGLSAIIITLASILKRKNDFATTLSLTLLIQIISNPYVIFDIGLILSYSGVIGIVYLYKIVNKFIKSKTISVTLSANLIIIPIMILNFNTFSFSFVISNIFASFLLGPIIILGYGAIIFRFKFIFAVLSFLVSLLSKVAELSAKLPFSNIYVTTPSIISIAIYYFMIFKIYKYFKTREKSELEYEVNDDFSQNENKKWKTNFKKNKKTENDNVKLERKKQYLKINNEGIIKFISICLILIFISNINFQHFSNALYINFIDVSQGDSCLIREGNKTIIIDGGGANNSKSNYNIGKSTLLPYLLDRKIKSIDYMIFSHFDNDHCQGLIYLLQEIKVKNVIIGKQYEQYENYKKFKQTIKEKNIKVYEVQKGDILRLTKNVEFDILWPDSENMISENSINNNSMVAKLKYKNFSMIFTGDIEKIAEEKILEEYGANEENYNKSLNSTILKVAHHGSKTSSISNFIEAVNPKYALIGVGKDNKFGHPSNETIKTLEKHKIKIYRTDQNGEISIKVTKNKIKISKHIKE